MRKFSSINRLCKCGCCGKLTHSSVGGQIGIELCPTCLASGEQENAHNDGYHHASETCPRCNGVSCMHEGKTTIGGCR